MKNLPKGRHLSVIRELRRSRRRYLYNKKIKDELKNLSKRFESSIEKKDLTNARKLLNKIYSKYDKAVKKGVIHWRKAARKKSRLTEKLNLYGSNTKEYKT